MPQSKTFDKADECEAAVPLDEGKTLRPIGVSFRSVNAFAYATPTDYQRTFGNFPLALAKQAASYVGYGRRRRRVDILRDCEGLVKSGEMCLVLGRPGAGCSTLLRTIAGETKGFCLEKNAAFNYQGISAADMHTRVRGDCSYQAELDVHFPTLTTCETVMVPVRAQQRHLSGPAHACRNVERATASRILGDLGLSHVADTKVGNEEIPGISGGERKRLSVAEVLACNTSLQCWDNSTRGLDSANSLQFIRTVRDRCNRLGTTALMSLYQASDDVFKLFDKVCVLYEGYLVYFGPTWAAREYFERLGYVSSKGDTEAEFLTSVTNPARRRVHAEHDHFVPQTPVEMASRWHTSLERAELLRDIALFEETHPLSSIDIPSEPYEVGLLHQVSLCVTRGFIRLKNDLAPPISNLVGNCILGVVLGTVFLSQPDDTRSFFTRSALLFFATLLNAFVSGFEPGMIWDSRPIVEKHYRYALYRPISDAIASMICDLPNKLAFSIMFNVPLYFLPGLRRTASAFWTFWLFSFTCLLAMSMIFRAIGSWCTTLAGSMAPAALFMLLLMIYSGFPLPVPYMRPWLRWFNYVNPVGYTFESLMINEFSGRSFPCQQFIPQGREYEDDAMDGQTCNVVGAIPGQPFVLGDDHIWLSYGYSATHLWRNFGILVAIMAFACFLHLLGATYATVKRSRGEVLLFRDEKMAWPGTTLVATTVKGSGLTETLSEKPKSVNAMHGKVAICWDSVTFDVKAGEAYKRILNEIDGWIEHGTLTALMGESGAGKTTLLNVLAGRASIGIVRGDMLIDPLFASEGYARKIGYAQQQDVHLPTATVREALQFSALLRQPRKYSKEERLAYVEKVIASLRMEAFADAIVGVAGIGLNVEQRKRFTIGVELAARPELLLFMDEPTSGLDSDTAWAICSLLRRLANEGQAILCTIHQPSESLFAMFDRLLLLRQGRCIYFGDIGPQASTVIRFFETRGARPCVDGQNPAEWLFDVTNSSTSSIEWVTEWERSAEKRQNRERIQGLRGKLQKTEEYDMSKLQYATSFASQLGFVTTRLFTHFWRTPTYLYSKAALCLGSALVIGVSFWLSPNTLQGIQNEIFAVFLLVTIFTNLDQQIIPQFTAYRSVFQIREGPSKMYSWVVFLLANFIVEMVWQTLMAVILFVCWYYPIGMQRNGNPTHDVSARSGIVFLFIWSFMQFTLSLSYLVAAGMASGPTAVNIAQLLYSLSLIFCGVLAKPSVLPHFWKWLYHVTPLTYYIGGLLSATLGEVPVRCSPSEIVSIPLPSAYESSLSFESCERYLATFISRNGGALVHSSASELCSYCPVTGTKAVLDSLEIHGGRWWRLGVSFGYVLFNIAGTFLIYWAVWVRTKGKRG